MSQFTLHGRVEGSYFRVDRNLKLIPFWPIYYMHWEKLVLLGNDSDGNLIVLMHDVGSGAILMMGAGHKLLHTFKAERIKN